ncbi:hypothetical protein U1Q18_048166, partial [Sarracenia purpurea var. burkii]
GAGSSREFGPLSSSRWPLTGLRRLKRYGPPRRLRPRRLRRFDLLGKLRLQRSRGHGLFGGTQVQPNIFEGGELGMEFIERALTDANNQVLRGLSSTRITTHYCRDAAR